MPSSDVYAKPRAYLVHRPSRSYFLSENYQELYNFGSVPNWSELLEEIRSIATTIKSFDFEVYEIGDLIDRSEKDTIAEDPNSIFTRDPIITLPWLPNWAIVANMGLSSRQLEPQIFKSAVSKLGVNHFLEAPPDVRLEGGDALALNHLGRRTLFLGNGSRTNIEAAMWLAEMLIKNGHLDEIIVFKHNRAMLHLDTCFSILPNKTILCANDTFRNGFLIDSEMRLKTIDPLDYLKSQNYRLIYISQDEAEDNEGCNLLYLGNNNYLAFHLPKKATEHIEALSGIKIHQLKGIEISKANGGVHCLTLPIY
jgi:N-dimethylarginine dimethylaminohydrolase